MIRRLPTPLVLLVAAAVLSGCAQGAPSPTSTGAPAQVVRVSFTNGQVDGDTGTVPVALGTPVRLEVTSDAAEEAHLHGYDLDAEVPAGGTAAIDFTADIPGDFEFELHHSGAPLATLRVS